MKMPIFITNPAQSCAFRRGFIANGFSANLEEGSRGNEECCVRQDKRRLLETLSHCLHIFFLEACDYCRRCFPASC